MQTQTLKLDVDEDTTIMVQIRNNGMDTDSFHDEAVDVINNYTYNPEHYRSIKTETTQY